MTMRKFYVLIPIIGLLILTFFTRIYLSATVPDSEAFDITWNLSDALRISKGEAFPAFFDTRPEPFYRFLLAGWYKVGGASIFTTRLLQTMIATITCALVYRATITLFKNHPYRHWVALLASATIIAIPPHLFLTRAPYRAALLPMALSIALIALLRAYQTKKWGKWAIAGFFSGLAVNTYLAGLATIPYLIGFIIHQAIFQKKRRFTPRLWLISLILMGIAIIPYIILIALVPDLFGRAQDMATSLSITDRITSGISGLWRAIFVDGWIVPIYSTPYNPFLNPLLGILALLGAVFMIRRWRHGDSALIYGGIICFAMPATLSIDPNHPVRLVGIFPFLAILVAWGALVCIEGFVWIVKKYQAQISPNWAYMPLVLLAFSSVIATHHAYQSLFADPARYTPPELWPNIPQQFPIGLYDALLMLTEATQPTYIPIGSADNPLGYFILQNEAYPHVTTWARAGLTTLPEGQIFYPATDYYHTETYETSELQLLLLPKEKTIIILPMLAPLQKPRDGTPVYNDRGWVVAYTAPRPAEPLPDEFIYFNSAQFAPTIGDSVQLINNPNSIILANVSQGQTIPITLYWRVIAPAPTDFFSVAMVVDEQFNGLGVSDHYILPYLYPSGRWQVGDIIPDFHQLNLLAYIPNTTYRFGTGLYVPPHRDLVSLTAPIVNNAGNLWVWGVVHPPTPSITIPQTAKSIVTRLGDNIELLAYELFLEGNHWRVGLYWQTNELPEENLLLFIHAIQDEKLVGQWDGTPTPQTWAWIANTIIYTEHIVTVTDIPDKFFVGLYRYPSFERLSAFQDDEPAPDNRIVIPVNP